MSFITIHGYASIFNGVDEQKDRISPGAFKKSLEKPSAPKMLWQHRSSQPIGRWTHLEENQRGLYVKGLLFLDIPQGQEAWVLIQNKVLDGFSIGFQVQKAARCPRTGVRTLFEINLIEISLVTFAAAQPWTHIRWVPPIRDPTSPEVFNKESLKKPVSKNFLNHIQYLSQVFRQKK